MCIPYNEETAKLIFQFHKGTIKTLYRVGIRPMMQNFNSIKVRLKPNISPVSSFCRKFQFHKGTIKTQSNAVGKPTTHYFNSIKVRLKHSVSHSFEFHN